MRYSAIVVCVALGAALAQPANAGWFDSSPPKPTMNDEVVAQIQAAIDDQRYLDAGKLLDEAVLVEGENPKIMYEAGELALVKGGYEEALMDFKSMDGDPTQHEHSLQGEGIALSLLGKSEEAVAALQAAVSIDAKDWRAWNVLGTEYDRHHDWKMAEFAYENAVVSSDSAAIVLNNRGFSRLCQNHLDEAVADFVAALQKKPDMTAARNNLRLAIAMKGQYDRAMEGADTADRAAMLNNVGFAALLRGDYPAAESYFDQAIKAKGKYYAQAEANLEMAKDMESHRGDSTTDAHAAGH